MSLRPDYTLYFIADIPDMMDENKAPEIVDTVLEHGGTIVQLRGKKLTTRRLYEAALRLRDVTSRHNVSLIINDRLDVALASNADGIHVGKDDLPLPRVREILPKGIIGYSIDDEADIRHAQASGADYLSAGPVFPTKTKSDTSPTLGTQALQHLASQAKIPCVAIGGITPANIHQVAAADVDGACTISGILNAPNIAAASRAMACRMKQTEI